MEEIAMVSLDSPRWSTLTHAYGGAADIPALLQQLERNVSANGNAEPWFSIWSALAHQGDVYPASFAAVPHVLRIALAHSQEIGGTFLLFPAWVEICRGNKKVEVPSDLAGAYGSALSSLPTLVDLVSNREWDEDFVLSALSALAVGKGHVKLAEAVCELSGDVLPDFFGWFGSR